MSAQDSVRSERLTDHWATLIVRSVQPNEWSAILAKGTSMVRLEIRICQVCADRLTDNDAALALRVLLLGQCDHADSILVAPAPSWTA
jgi:hypothetical protein